VRILWTMDYNIHTDERQGGDVFSTRLLVQGLKALGHDVMTMNPIYPRGRWPWYVWRVRTAQRFARGLRRALQRSAPSVVITQNHVFPYVVREARNALVPVVVVARDHGYRCPNPPAGGPCDRRCAHCVGPMALVPYPWFRYHMNMKRKFMPMADAWVVNSQHLADDMRTWLPETRPEVVYPPVGENHRPEVWNPRRVLYMGRGDYKGADVVLELAEEFQGDGIDFTICGDQHPSHRRKFEVLDNVELLGWTTQGRAFQDARVLLSPSRWAEPFCRTIIEAGSIGIPTIASDVGGQSEAVGPGGVMINEPGDVELWSENLAALMNGGSWWRCLSREAVEHSRRFTVESQSKRLEKILLRVSSNGED